MAENIPPNNEFENLLNQYELGKLNVNPITNSSWSQQQPGGLSDEQAYNNLLSLSNKVLSTNQDARLATPVSPKDVDTTGRYPKQVFGFDNEELYAGGQSWGSKMLNGVLKGTALAGTTFLQGTLGLINGTKQAIQDGRMASFYDNDFNKALDQFNKELENRYLPNYYTKKELNANWYSPDNLFTANFLWDKIVKNLGFAAGAALTGSTYAAVLRAIPLTARLFSIGKAAEIIQAQEEAIAGGKAFETLGRIRSLSDKFLNNYKLLNAGGRATVAGLSTVGEASMEAFQNLNEYRDSLIKEYTDAYGTGPTGEALDAINQSADKVGNWTFGLNTALLTATNYIQFPRILGSSQSLEKGIYNDLAQQTKGIVRNEAGELVKKAASSRILSTLNRVRPYLFSGTEAFEEGSQFAIQKGTEHYFNKAYHNTDNNDLWDAISAGIGQTVHSKEGIENILIGGFSGTIMTAHGRFHENSQIERNTQEALPQLNKRKLSDFTKDTIDSLNRAAVLEGEKQQAVQAGDILEAKDLEKDYILNYLTPRVKYGRYDLVAEDIAAMKAMAATREGFTQLQAEGKALPNDTQQAFQARLQQLESTAGHVASLYQSLNLRYSGLMDEKGNRVYAPETIDKMVYAASKVADYDSRIPQLSATLLSSGISAQKVIDAVTEKQGTDIEEFGKAMQSIDQMDILEEDKDTLKQNLQDVAELSLRRKQFLKEYEEIKKSPKKFEQVQQLTPTAAAPGEKQTLKIKTKDGEEELEIGTEYYLGRVVEHSKEGKEVYRFPRLTIMGKNQDGTIQVKGSNGQLRNIKEEELASYRLGKVSDVKNNKKASFYLEHINDIFEFNFGKGKKANGRLQYSPKKNTLKFVYKNDKGQVRSMEVTGDQFVAKKGFNTPMIQKVGTLTAQQQKTLEEFAAEQDQRKDEKRKSRFAIIEELVNETGNRITEVEEKLRKNKETLQNTEEELSKLTEKIEQAAFTQRGNFKAATRSAIKAASRLSQLRDSLTEENKSLEAEKQDLEMNLAYFYDLAQNIDELPTDSKEFLEELKNLTTDVEDLILHTGLQINSISGILKNVEKALQSAIDLALDLLGKFESAYPKAPTNTSSREYVEFLKANPNFLKLNPFFKDDVKKVEEILSQIEDMDIKPNERTVGELRTQLQGLQDQLSELEKEYKAKKAIFDKFQQKANEFKREQALQAKLKADTVTHNALFKAQEPNTTEPPVIPTGTHDTKADIENRGKLKPLSLLFTTTTAPSRETDKDFESKPHLVREERFKNALGLGQIEGQHELEALVVHQGNEAALGLKGLIASTTNSSTTPGEEPIVYVYIRKTASGFFFVDENGNNLSKVTEQADLNKVVSSVAPSSKLEGKQWHTPQHSPKPEAYQQAWAEKRAEWLKTKDATDSLRLPILGTSRGHTQKNVVNGEYTDKNPVTEVLVTPEQLDKGQVLFVSTGTERAKVVVGGQEISLKSGTAYFQAGDTLEFANNRLLTQQEAETIYQVIHRLSQIWAKEGRLDKQLTDWLNSIIYWYAPSETNSQVHAHQIYVKDGSLHIGPNNTSIFFNPETIEKAKDTLLKAFLEGNTAGKGTWHHVSNRALNKFGQGEYTQILGVNADGSLQTRQWPSYQHYLTSPALPGGEKREGPLPVTTNVRKTTSKADSNIRGRYVKMGIELGIKEEPKPTPVQTPAAPTATQTPAPAQPAGQNTVVTDGATVNTFTGSGGEKIRFTTDGKTIDFIQDEENKKQQDAFIDRVYAIYASKNPGTAPEQLANMAVQAMNGNIAKLIQENAVKQQAPAAPEVTATSEETKAAEPTLTLEERLAKLQATTEQASELADPKDEYSRVLEQSEAIEREDWPKVEAWFKKNLPNVPVQRVRQLLQTTDGGLAWGKFGRAGITLFEGARNGTGYHEAFEAVYGLFVSEDEKSRMHKAFTKRSGSFLDVRTGQMIPYSEATPSQMKEALADEFAGFVQREEKLSEALRQSPAIVRFFKELWRTLQSLFANPEHKLFSAINKGQYSSFPVNLGRVLNEEYSRVPFDWQVQHELMQDITANMLYYFFDRQNRVVNLAELSDGKNIPIAAFYDRIKNALQSRFQQKATQAIKSGNRVAAEKWIDLAEKVQSNWKELTSINEEYLKTLNIVKKQSPTEADELAASKKLSSLEEDEDTEAAEDVETSVKQDSRSHKEYDRDIFTIDTKENATAAIKLLFATISQRKFSSSETRGLSAIRATEPIRSSVGGLQFVEFAKVFNTVLSELSHTKQLSGMLAKLARKAEVDPNMVDLIGKLGLDKTSGELNYSNLSYDDWRLLLDFFKTMSKQRPQALIYFQKGDKGQLLAANRFSAVELLKKKFIQNLKKSSVFTYDKVEKKYKANPEFTKNISLKTPEDFISFTRMIGINQQNGEAIMSAAALLRLPKSQRDYFQRAVSKVAEQMSKQQPIYTVTGKSLQIETPINTIADTIIQATSDDVESTFFNIMGEKVQTFVLNNPYSNFFSNFNQAKDFAELSLLERGLTGGFSRGSQLLKAGGEFISADGSRTEKQIEVGYIDGTISQKGPRQSSKMSLIARKLQSFNLNLQGWSIPITNGDKKTEWILSLGNRVSFEQVAAGADGWNRIYRTFQDYLVAEIQTAQEDSLKNHAALKGRAGKLRFFHNILQQAGEELLSDIEVLIREKGSEKAIQAGLEQHIPAINKAVKEFIQRETKVTEDELRSYKIIETVENPEGEKLYTRFNGIDEQFLYEQISEKGENQLTEKQLQDILLFRTANQIINNVELHKLFFGDPALMKDPIKRIPGASGGVIQAVHNNQEFNQRFQDTANRVDIKNGTGLSLKTTDLGYMPVTDEVPTLVFDEVQVKGRHDYENHLIDEADAQSKMSLPAYREMKIRTAEWNTPQENRYQYEMARLRQRAEKQFGYTYSSEELKAHDEKLLKSYDINDGVVYEHIKPKGFGQNQDSAYIDKVYWKTAVKPLIPSAVEGSNDELLMLHMMRSGIKVAAVPSAIKLGVKQTIPFYKDGKFNDSSIPQDAVLRPGWENTGIQVETQFSQGKNSGTLGSQLSKMGTMNLLEGGLPLDYLKGKNEDARYSAWNKLSESEKRAASPIYDAVQQNGEVLSALIENGYEDLLEELSIQDRGGSYEISDYQKAVDFIKTEARDLDDNTRAALQVNQTLDGLQTPLEAIPNYTQIKAVLYSLVDKRIASPKVSGGGYVQSSSWGTEAAAEDRTLLVGNSNLKWYTKEEPWMEIMLPFWAYKKLADQYQKMGQPIPTEEQLAKLINDDPSILKGIGFRIPTQEINSVEVFKVKAFLPQVMGNTVVVPTEITKKSGSDFDVDKLNTYLKNLQITKDGKIKAIPSFASQEEARSYFEAEFDQKIKDREKSLDKAASAVAFKFSKVQGYDPDMLSEREMEKNGSLLDELLEDFNTTEDAADHLMQVLEKIGRQQKDLRDGQLQTELKEAYVKRHLRKSLENAYYDSLHRLLTLPENYEKLINPNDASEFKGIRNTLNKALYTEEEILAKNIETGAKNKPLLYTYLLSPSNLDEIRHNLITGKYGVGIAAQAQTNNALVQKIPVTLDFSRIGLNPNEQRMANLGDGVLRFQHNTLNGLPTLSKMMDKAAKLISRKISQYVDGFVDVAKDTFIMELGVNLRTAGTFLFMDRMGNPIEHTAYFMNQPVIRDYLKRLDQDGINGIFSKAVMQEVLDAWGTEQYQDEDQLPTAGTLLDNIRKFKEAGREKEKMEPGFLAEQARIFREFIKYQEMASDLFHLSQGLTWDTAHMSDPEMFYLKGKKFQKANRTLFTPAEEILKHTFIGKVKQRMLDSRDAIGTMIALEHPTVRKVLERVKDKFINDDFLPNEQRYSRIARKVNNSFINYVIQVKGGYNKVLASLLTDSANGTAARLEKALKETPKDSPFLPILERFEVITLGEEANSVKAIQFRSKGKDAYSRNSYIAGLRALKDGPAYLTELYKSLVRHALVQNGIQLSPISYTHLIPNEDYSQAIAGVIRSLPAQADLMQFHDSDAFFRNNWKGDSIPNLTMKAGFGQRGPWATGFILPKSLQAFPKGTIVKSNRFEGEYVKYTPMNSTGDNGRYNPEDGKLYNAKKEYESGSRLMDKTYLYKVVRDSEGNPLTYRSDDGNFEYYVYKAINAWGMGQYAQEYYETAGRQSILDNNTFKVQELQDAEIEKALNGDKINMQENGSAPSSNGSLAFARNNNTQQGNLFDQATAPTSTDKVIEGDIWAQDGIPVITTNLGGIHGAGLANQAFKKGLIQYRQDGEFGDRGSVITFPVKKIWSDKTDVELLKRSAARLVTLANANPSKKYLLPLIGLGHGEGSISEIVPVIKQILDSTSNVQLVLPTQDTDRGKQGTARTDNSLQITEQVRQMLSTPSGVSSKEVIQTLVNKDIIKKDCK